jgi:MFS transporter, PPP family, 3-phenylpropionic acid transporter
MNKAIPFSFNFLFFAGMASIAPYFVLYYQELGFSGAQISVLAGLPPLVTLFFSPFWTNLADRTGRHKLIMSMGVAVVIAADLFFPALTSFSVVLLVVILLNIFISPISPLADSATMHMLTGQREMYGRIRIGGTIGWGVASPIAGALIARYGLNLGFWACAAVFVLVLILNQGFTFGRSEPAETRGSMRDLLSQRAWIYFMIYAFFGGVMLNSTSNYLSPYMMELGGTELHVGMINLVAAVSELPAFFFGNRLLRRFGSHRLMILSLVITGIRSFLFALSPTPVFAILAQVLNGMTFAAMWTAGVAYADEHAPAGLKATGQGMLGAMTFGVGSAVGGFLGGFLLESIGGRGLFLVFGVILVVGVSVVMLLERRGEKLKSAG